MRLNKNITIYAEIKLRNCNHIRAEDWLSIILILIA